ncbi:hypothetical protein [uncultured Rikenella sp.]|uniref:hypothetical protein n=1 Tax=uncultured Rikenella sp. TaxID=368003 RepID=UPI0025E02550|nr:hypothetical protein [uncultured Rikenella sp.]
MSGSLGSYGYSWSSGVSNTEGIILNFRMTWLYPSNPVNRGYGFQLRCLSE